MRTPEWEETGFRIAPTHGPDKQAVRCVEIQTPSLSVTVHRLGREQEWCLTCWEVNACDVPLSADGAEQAKQQALAIIRTRLEARLDALAAIEKATLQ